MTPSERIKVITEISKRLGTENWSVIDLTLKQFGLPISDQWSGSSTENYVLSMIQNATDKSLIELAEHVGYTVHSLKKTSIEPAFWRKGMLRVFLSHLSSQKLFTAELQEALIKYGISAFVAHNDIHPTDEWQDQIEIALATCDALVALLHKDFHQSNWTDQEIGFAMGRGVPTFAIRLGQDPYGFIGRFQAFNGISKSAGDLAKELFDVYRKNKQTQETMSDLLVGLFEDSGSFAEAKRLMEYLEEIEHWKPSYSIRIASAVEFNSQIDGSWGVTERVSRLIKKWENKGV
jgi:nucleoside 2-deoxyribosyltransferase